MKESYAAMMKKSSVGLRPHEAAPSSFGTDDEAHEPNAQAPPQSNSSRTARCSIRRAPEKWWA
jgi:hypothetical protein